MKGWGQMARQFLSILVVFAMVFQACAPARVLEVQEIEPSHSVKIYTMDGKVVKGVVTKRERTAIVLVSEADHQPHTIALKDIRRVERSDQIYDYDGYPISEAEIGKYKDNRNAWGYAIGGAALGGLVGLVVALPMWYADVGGVPPYFVSGIGAVAGSIFFAMKGIKKDREIAIEKIRYIRKRERELARQKEEEQKRLEQIQKEKEELLRKLKTKQKKDGTQQ